MYKNMVRMSDDLAEKLKKKAEKEKRSINNAIIIAVKNYIGTEKDEEQALLFEEYDSVAPNMYNLIRDAENKEEAIKMTVDAIVRGLLKTSKIID